MPGIKASMINWTEPPMELIGDRWYGPPGAFINGTTLKSWRLCCPGCGELGSPRDGQSWKEDSGSFADVSTLTLTPSILKSCCGWHGYLINGVFEAC